MMLKVSLILGTVMLLSTPLESDAYGRCERCSPCSSESCPPVICHNLQTSPDALGFQCACSRLGSQIRSDCHCEDIETCTKFQSEIRNQCRRDLNCSRSTGSYTCVCFIPTNEVNIVVSPSAPSSPVHLVVPKSTAVERSSVPETSDSGSNRTGEVVGIVLGTVIVVISVVLTTTAAIVAVCRYRKRRATETLEPWPEVRRSEHTRDIHNPTYDSKEFPHRVSQAAIMPPVYEELDSPDTPAVKNISNPLYAAGDYAYEPIDLYHSYSDASPFSNSDSDRYMHARTQECQYDNDCSKPNHPCPDEIREAQILDDDDARDYSQLDPNTQYASLEPYTGSTADLPKEPTTEKEHDSDDYSHLQH